MQTSAMPRHPAGPSKANYCLQRATAKVGLIPPVYIFNASMVLSALSVSQWETASFPIASAAYLHPAMCHGSCCDKNGSEAAGCCGLLNCRDKWRKPGTAHSETRQASKCFTLPESSTGASTSTPQVLRRSPPRVSPPQALRVLHPEGLA